MVGSELKAKEILEEIGFKDVTKQKGGSGVPDFKAQFQGSSCEIEVKSAKNEILETQNETTATLKRHQMHRLAQNLDSGNRSFVLYFDKVGRYFLFELRKAKRTA